MNDVRWAQRSLQPSRIRTLAEPSTKLDAYLVEARSWGGQSGSPAFFLDHPYRDPRIGIRMDKPGRSPGWFPSLLGLVSHHYDIKRKFETTGDVLGEAQLDVNTGMAVVIPGQNILDLLHDEDFVRERDEMAKAQAESGSAATPDSAVPATCRARAASPQRSCRA
jgi:hypothetical protein